MSQFEADMLLLGTLADKTQQNIVLRSVDNITGTVYHQLIGNAENQQEPIFIDVNENGYFSKKDFSYLLGPKPETLHVDDSLKPLEIMPETDYFSSFASLSALFVFMFYYSDGLQ